MTSHVTFKRIPAVKANTSRLLVTFEPENSFKTMQAMIVIEDCKWLVLTFKQRRQLLRDKYSNILYAWWNMHANSLHELRSRIALHGGA